MSTFPFFTYLRKLPIMTVAVSVLFAGLLILTTATPKLAHAQFGGVTVEGPGPLLSAALTTAPAAVTTASAAVEQSVISKVLNGLAWTVAKTAVQSITQSMVNWINNGFQGSPAFVTDLNENMGQLSDAVAYDFFNHLDQNLEQQTGFNLRSPFQDQISQRIREEYYLTSSSYGFDARYAYTLGDVSSDPQAFYNGDFSKGGFNAWLSTSQRPANNPFGAYLLATNELSNQIADATEKRKVELGWGNGFLSWRGNCTSTSGLASGLGSSPLKTSLDAPVDINSLKQDVTINADGTVTGGASAAASAPPVSLSQKDDCLGHRIQTPGAVVETQLEGVLGSGVRQLELADSINEIVGALLGQMVNQVAGGVGLSGLSQPSYGGGSSYINQAGNGNQYASAYTSLAQGFTQTINTERKVASTFQNNWQTIYNASQSARNSCTGNASAQAQADTVFFQAGAGIAKAEAAVTALNDLTTKMNTAANNPYSSQVNAVADVTSEYQSLLSSSVLPSAEEQSFAITNSQDSGANIPASLYTQMKNLSRSCGGV